MIFQILAISLFILVMVLCTIFSCMVAEMYAVQNNKKTFKWVQRLNSSVIKHFKDNVNLYDVNLIMP